MFSALRQYGIRAGSFAVEGDPSRYGWLRRFKSEAERKRLYARVHETGHWKMVIAPKGGQGPGPFLHRSDVHRPTGASLIQ